jgi:hypothetical protein
LFGTSARPASLSKALDFDLDVAAFASADVDSEIQFEVGAFDPFEGRVLEDRVRVFVAAAAAAPTGGEHRRQAGDGEEGEENSGSAHFSEVLLIENGGARWYG